MSFTVWGDKGCDNSVKVNIALTHLFDQGVFAFQFGGKLISFEDVKVPAGQQQQQQVSRQVHISQVITEPDLVSRSNQLEAALANNQFAEFCALKISNSKNEMEENIWSFLKVRIINYVVDTLMDARRHKKNTQNCQFHQPP